MFRRKKGWKPLLRRPALFLFLGAAVVIFATALAIEQGSFRPEALFPEAQVEDWRTYLPQAWNQGTLTSLVVSEDARPTRLVGWNNGVAVVYWDRDTGRYLVSPSLQLSSVFPGIQGPPVLTKADFGSDVTVALAKARLGLNGRAAFFVEVKGGREVELVRLVDSKGGEQGAVMRIGNVDNGSVSLEIRDVDGDGRQEAVVSSRTFKASGPGAGWGNSVDVYKWNGGVLVYDSQLSWALTMEASIFPEPPAKVDSGS